jgi:hypothetical protein
MTRWEWEELFGARKKRCLYDRYDAPIFEIAPPVRSFSSLQGSGVLDASGGESNRCCDDTDETGV